MTSSNATNNHVPHATRGGVPTPTVGGEVAVSPQTSWVTPRIESRT